MRGLLTILVLPLMAVAQTPQLAVRPVYPTSGSDTRSRVEYSIVPVKGVNAAWIEVWDRPNLLSRTRVEVSQHGQILMPDDYEVPDTPDTLRIAIYDPQVTLSCTDFCGKGVGIIHGDTVSETVIGVSDPKYWPTPDVDGAIAQRVAAGTEGPELVVLGHGFSSRTRVLLVDEKFEDPQPGQGGSSFAHTVLTAPTTQFVDSCTLRIKLSSGDVLRPAHRRLYVTNEIEEDRTELDRSTAYLHRAESLYVVRPDSPVIDKVGPVVRGSSPEEWLVTLWGKNFTPHVVAHLGPDVDSFASWRIDTEVVSPTELRMRFTDDPRRAYQPLLWLADDDDETRVSEAVAFQREPSASLKPDPLPALICSVEPYPFEMLQPNSPKSVRMRVRGYHFRPDDVVVFKGRYSLEDRKLKTTFVSPEEISARFPSDLWRVHKISFRLLVKSGGKQYEVEVPDTD